MLRPSSLSLPTYRLGEGHGRVTATLRECLALDDPIADHDLELFETSHLPDLIFSSNSARRSIDSSAPSCMPEATMPSRSITDWNTLCSTTRVLLPRASKVDVCNSTCPGTPSYSNVAQMRSGATTSWLTPRKMCSLPSSPMLLIRHEPPACGSNL